MSHQLCHSFWTLPCTCSCDLSISQLCDVGQLNKPQRTFHQTDRQTRTHQHKNGNTNTHQCESECTYKQTRPNWNCTHTNPCGNKHTQRNTSTHKYAHTHTPASWFTEQVARGHSAPSCSLSRLTGSVTVPNHTRHKKHNTARQCSANWTHKRTQQSIFFMFICLQIETGEGWGVSLVGRIHWSSEDWKICKELPELAETVNIHLLCINWPLGTDMWKAPCSLYWEQNIQTAVQVIVMHWIWGYACLSHSLKNTEWLLFEIKEWMNE